ncbi:MAG: Ig-like domain-containing protein [Patescibacteria group bacterium]|nr:Ig-like domain-containing protein [Patescibacteria group bacterium]
MGNGHNVRAFIAVAVFAVAAWLVPASVHAAITWSESDSGGFGDVNNTRTMSLVSSDQLYVGTSNATTGAEVWAYDGDVWSQVNTDGFGDANNVIISSMAEYNGSLYVATYNEITGVEVWRYRSSVWTQVNTNGFGDVHNFSGFSMLVFDEKLYVGSYNFWTGAEIWSYDGTDWNQVNDDGFGDAGNLYTDSLVEYNGKLLAGAGNVVTGGQLHEYDGTSWTALNDDGFGDINNLEPFSLYANGSVLYIGTWNPTTGVEAWTYDGSTFTQIGDDGFGDLNNATLLAITKYNSTLTFGTRNLVTGAEVWTYDGNTFAQVNDDGFGDSSNTRAYGLVEHGHHLYIGTENTVDGAGVWDGFVADTTGPTFDNLSPGSAETGVSPNSDVSFFVSDELWEVDTYSIDVTINGHRAVTDGVYESGYGGTMGWNGTHGYTVTINPDDNFYYRETVEVAVTASDELGNESQTAWTFMTSDAIPSLGIVVTPASAGGPNVRIVEDDGTQIESFFAYDQSLRMGLEVAQADIDADSVNEIVITPGAGVESRIKAFELDGTEMANTLAFNEGFTGGVNLATGDFDGDHKEDIAVTPIGAGGPNIRIYTYNVAEEEFELMDWFFGYSEEFRGGVNLASGDLDSDGVDELIVTPRGAMAPIVKVFRYSAADQEFDLVDSVTAYQDTFFGGVQVATGDVDSDGNDDIIVAPFLNGGPNIRIYTLNGSDELELLDWLMAYDSSYRGTLSMQVGDTDGDGSNEVVLAPKTLGDSTVKVLRYQGGDFEEVDSFMAYDAHFMGGVNLFVNDVDADGFDEVMTSPASHGGPNLRVYDYDTDTGVLKDWFWVFPIGFRGGVNFGK